MNQFSSATGLVIGLVGGFLDLASGAGLLLAGMQQGTMGGIGVSYRDGLLALGLFWLGAIVIVTAVVSTMSAGRGHPKLLAGLMVVYGILMLLIGGSMAGGMVGMMSTPYYGYGMIVVGILMLVNGSTMSRARMMM